VLLSDPHWRAPHQQCVRENSMNRRRNNLRCSGGVGGDATKMASTSKGRGGMSAPDSTGRGGEGDVTMVPK
jgi:hypothetical protein